MSAYEQAIAERNLAQSELAQIEADIQQIEQQYSRLNDTSLATAASFQTTEQERNRMATKLNSLLQEHARWRAARNDAEHAMQREIERQVNEWHGEVIHQEQAREQATTPEAAQAATRRRDQAQTEMERSERELNALHDQEQENE